MKEWLVLQSANIVKQIAEHPFLSACGAIFMLIFNHGFGATQAVFITYVLFAVLIVLDWLSGTSAAKKDKIDTSQYSYDGWKKSMFLLAVPAVARLIDLIIGTNVVVMGIVTAAMARGVARSVLANIKRAGWISYFPDWLIKWIQSELDSKDARAEQRLNEIKKKASGE